MKIEIIKGKGLSYSQLTATGELLYLTDKYIYPAAFANAQNMGKVLHFLSKIDNGLFSLKNLNVAIVDGEVCGAIVGCRNNIWDNNTLKKVFFEAGLDFPECADDVEENYFRYEANNEIGDYVLCLCVSPAFRGKGVAKTLMKEYLKNKKEVSLECLMDNLAALNLYRSLGFKIISQYDGYSAPGMQPVSVVKMKYSVN